MNQPLAETLFWIAAIACVIAELAILRSTFAARRVHKSELVPSASPRGELAWAVIPALALGVVLTATWQRIDARDTRLKAMDHSGMDHSMPMPAPTSAPTQSMLTLRRIGLLALILGFAQVVFGAIVRITGSGMGCGDHWPDCFGSFTPAHNGPTLLVEISHRYGAAALSLAIVALVVAAWVKRREPGVAGPGGVLRASLLAIVLVVVAALFGAVTVKMGLHPWIVVTHLAIAMALLAVLVAAVVRAGGFGALSTAEPSERTLRGARAAAGLTFLALVMGALTANTPGAPLSCAAQAVPGGVAGTVDPGTMTVHRS